MAAAAVVEAAGGSSRQASDAAAIAFQNTMGSVCDLVLGTVEIPCHTRNAVAAASAFVCADLVLGGYANPIPLDETIDAVFEVGRMLPAELRCTSLRESRSRPRPSPSDGGRWKGKDTTQPSRVVDTPRKRPDQGAGKAGRFRASGVNVNGVAC